MFTIKKIPNYLPTGILIDNSQIGCIPHYVHGRFYSEDMVQVGGAIRLIQDYSKYVITTYHSDNVVKEHVFISNSDIFKDISYPVFIRTYNLNNPHTFTSSPILLRKGIYNTRCNIFEDELLYSNLNIDFTVHMYLSLIHNQIDDNDVLLKGILDYVIKTVNQKHMFYATDRSLFTSIENVGIECADAVSNLLDILENDTESYGHQDNIIHNLLGTFGPDIDYSITADPFSIQCYRNGMVDSDYIKWYSRYSNASIDDTAEKDTLIEHYIRLSDEIVYGDIETFKNAKSLLTTMKESPYTDIYLKYILHNSNGNLQLNLTNQSLISNKYYSLVINNIPNDYWLLDVENNIKEFFYDLLHSRPYMEVKQLEVILRDYHVLLVLETEELRILYIFDLVLMTMLTDSIMYTVDHYR